MVVLCWICNKFASRTFKAVLRHIRSVHSFDPSFEIVCGINDCPRSYKNFLSYKKHIIRKHLDVYDPQRSSRVNSCRNASSSEDDEDADSDMAAYSSNSPSHIVLDSTVADSESTGEINESDLWNENLAALFILKMKEIYKMSQSSIDSITTDFTELLQSHLHNYKLKVKRLLLSTGIEVDKYPQITEFLHQEELTDPFISLQTKFLQEKYFRENLALLVSAP